jgi:DNA polymerase III subunit gamma/tau
MSNLVLYRKYRPQKFSEVVGQNHVTKTLLNAISSDKIAHAYLFCGPRGCGKTTVARLLAKGANCEKTDSPEPCNKCTSCKEIMNNMSMDIIEVDAASHRGIDEIRELREGVRFGPAKSKNKVFILDEAHQLTSGAANALLKILEEAPSHVIFILATTEPQKMISTIISRCQRFDFRKITMPEVVKRLEAVAKKEGANIEKEVFPLIASASGGSLRDAESLLSQIISFVSENDTVRKEDVKNLLGIIEREFIADFIDSLLGKKAEGALRLIEDSLNQGNSPEALHENIMNYLREMMILKIISKDEEKGASSLMNSVLTRLTREEVERIREQVKDVEGEEIRKMINFFHEAGQRIKYSPVAHLPLEVAVAEITENLRKEEN